MAHRWYVIRTEPRAEFLAAGELQKDGIEIFFPRVKAIKPRIGRTDNPYFPGYLFVRCDPEGSGWPHFRPSHRVLGWVRFGNQIPSLPDDVMQALKESSQAINHEGGLWHRFLAGDKVNVVSSGISGLAEVAEDVKSPNARVRVLLEFMGRLVSAQVPWESLQPVGNQAGNDPRETQRPPRRTRGGRRWVRGVGLRATAVS